MCKMFKMPIMPELTINIFLEKVTVFQNNPMISNNINSNNNNLYTVLGM